MPGLIRMNLQAVNYFEIGFEIGSNERLLSGVELTVATVANWPDADGRKMAIYRPFSNYTPKMNPR